MTRKNARKTAARARQEKTGGSYQSALNAGAPKNDYEHRVREAFMVLNSGLGFTGHLAPTREQLMGRIQLALQILAPPEDAVMQSLRHHRFPFDVTEDIHTATAAMLGSTREGAKEINAALIYGSSGSPPGFAITETRDIEVVERALDGSIREMRPVPGSERVTITRMPFRVEDLSQLRALKGAKRCTAPKLRLIGVTDGTIVRWATLTSARKDHEFSAWWRSLPVAAPYSRVENDER